MKLPISERRPELRTLWALWTSFRTKCPARLSKPPGRALAGHFSGQSVQQDNCVRYGFLRSPDFAASCRLCRANRRITSSSSLSASAPSSSWLPVGPRGKGFGTGPGQYARWVVASLDPTLGTPHLPGIPFEPASSPWEMNAGLFHVKQFSVQLRQ
jgi:hypothetical protein